MSIHSYHTKHKYFFKFLAFKVIYFIYELLNAVAGEATLLSEFYQTRIDYQKNGRHETEKVLIPTKLTLCSKYSNSSGKFTVTGSKDSIGRSCAANPDAYGLLSRSEKVTSENHGKHRELKIVVRAGAGYDNIGNKAEESLASTY